MLIRTGSGESRVFDFREVAPASASPEMFKSDPKLSKTTGTSVAVPGEIRGLYDAHIKFGRLPWFELFEPNIHLAEEGFLVTKTLYAMVSKFKGSFSRSPAMRETYLDAAGLPKAVGQTIRRPALAETLRSIARDGPNVFYSGYIADALVEEINRQGGRITKKDFEDYRTIEIEAVHGKYRDFNLLTVGSPASGQILIEALNILNGFDLGNPSQGSDDVLKRTHLIIETMKFAYASRMKLGDPAFVDIHEIIRKLESPKFAAKLRGMISPNATHPPAYYMDVFDEVKDHGTTHVSVLDSEGMGVSSTCTVNLEFGSKMMDPVTGIILNNEMDDFSIPGQPNQFSIPPSPSNYPEPGKRPVSSATPVIFEKNGRVMLIAGGTGGSRIISSTLLALVNAIDLQESPIAAISSPRYHHQLVPNVLIAEHDVNSELASRLGGLGHEVHVMAPGLYYSSVQMIKKDPISGRILAAADPRKDGGTSGY
jgi:gamma-glutamyltranspeptidase / glutathione hydrolase / leukotriene-C4 hydrolase